MNQPSRCWFPAKRHGWGWGFPGSPEGWAVTAGYLVALLLAVQILDPERNPVAFVVAAVVLSLAMVGVCGWKGEPPRWRWGGD